MVRELYRILNEVSFEEVSDRRKLPESFDEFLSEVKSQHYDGRTFAIRLKAMVRLHSKLTSLFPILIFQCEILSAVGKFRQGGEEIKTFGTTTQTLCSKRNSKRNILPVLTFN